MVEEQNLCRFIESKNTDYEQISIAIKF
jgi:hypothetical protein